MVYAGVERAVLVGEFVEVGIEVERRQLPPSVTRKELNFSLVKAERLEHIWTLQVVLRIHFSLQHAKHPVPARVGKCSEVEFLNVLPITVIARLGEVFGAGIHVKPVGEALAYGADVASGALRRLEDGHGVPSSHQFVGAR